MLTDDVSSALLSQNQIWIHHQQLFRAVPGPVAVAILGSKICNSAVVHQVRIAGALTPSKEAVSQYRQIYSRRLRALRQGAQKTVQFPPVALLKIARPNGLGTFEFVNTGRSTWDANTKLAPLPRDVDSPIYGDDWEAPHRVISVSEDTAPGEIGVFEFSITGREVGATYQSFGLLQEGNQWFDEDGGIEPAEITLRVVVDEDSTEDSGGGVDTGDVVEEEKGGCACASSTPRSGAWVGFLGLVGVLISRRR